MKNQKTIQEINEKIENGSVRVVTASEMIDIVAELGADGAVHEVDVVTTGTFGAMCSSGMWMNFGHAEPPIKMSKVWLNDVEAYGGVAAVDAYLGATQLSETRGMEYGGGHVIEDLIRRKSVHLRAEAYGTDCYPRKELSIDINIDEMNQATMSNPRNCYERYVAAVNSSDKTIYTYMGKLLPELGNATYSGAGDIAPIPNDPTFRTIGIGTRIFLGGAVGYITASGTQHSPGTGFSTLMLQGDVKNMSPEFIRGATFTRYGTSLYVGVGVPIPVLNSEIAKSTGISNEQIQTNVLDYGVPSRGRPTLTKVNYEELKSGAIEVNGVEVKTAPISSFGVASKITKLLAQQIKSGEFLLSEAVQLLPTDTACNPMVQRELTAVTTLAPATDQSVDDQFVRINKDLCVECGLCVSFCEPDVFAFDNDWTFTFRPELCVECELCGDVCPQKAISLRS
ncbi:MAG: 4Fe-4S binding protein [Candidatus Thorarchaeota archaeon]|nr:4Fe-4S binding protein [Candidatus Thorarchaeota archaeon]